MVSNFSEEDEQTLTATISHELWVRPTHVGGYCRSDGRISEGIDPPLAHCLFTTDRYLGAECDSGNICLGSCVHKAVPPHPVGILVYCLRYKLILVPAFTESIQTPGFASQSMEQRF